MIDLNSVCEDFEKSLKSKSRDDLIEELETANKMCGGITMNREILFRGKRVDNGILGDFVYGDLVKYILPENRGIETYILTQEEVKKALDFGGRIECDMIEIDPSTVCEYTGLTDKNGVKIFEGDILHENYHSEHDKIVFFGDAYFGWKFIHSQEMYDAGSEDCVCLRQQVASYYRVIGNIFDNPELLEDKP